MVNSYHLDIGQRAAGFNYELVEESVKDSGE